MENRGHYFFAIQFEQPKTPCKWGVNFFQKGKISEVKSCNKRNPYPNCKLVILGYLNSYEKSLNEII